MAIIYVCIYNICNANKSKYDLSVYEPTYTHTYTPFVCALSHISQSIFTYILCFIASRACHMFRIYDRYEYVMCVRVFVCVRVRVYKKIYVYFHLYLFRQSFLILYLLVTVVYLSIHLHTHPFIPLHLFLLISFLFILPLIVKNVAICLHFMPTKHVQMYSSHNDFKFAGLPIYFRQVHNTSTTKCLCCVCV